MYLTFPPLAIIVLAVYGLFLLVKAWRTRDLRKIYPVILSGLALLPLYIYFDAWEYARLSREFYNFDLKVYLVHIRDILKYGMEYSYLVETLVVCAILLKLLHASRISSQVRQMVLWSIVFFGMYILLIAMIPHFVFTRYLTVLAVTGIIVLGYLLACLYQSGYKKGATLLFAGILMIMGWKQGGAIYGRVYELTHRYKGPLDYEIPFIQKKYAQTDTLVIATNYEECAYMYYLDAKVIMGFVLNNLEEDRKLTPDIIIFRHDWAWNYEKSVFAPFFERAKYRKVEFPVYDYPYNNIPELNLDNAGHLYRTRYADPGEIPAHIYTRSP